MNVSMHSNHNRMTIGRRDFLGLCLAGAAPLVFGLPAQSPGPLTLVYFHDYPPFSWSAEPGKVNGIFVETLQEALSHRIGIELVHKGLPWARAQQMVRRGQADALCTIPTPERREYCEVSSETVLVGSMKMVARRDASIMERLADVEAIGQLQGLKTGSYIGSGWAKTNMAGLDVNWTRTLEQTLKMLVLGRIQVSIEMEHVVHYMIHQLGYEKDLVVLDQPLDHVAFHLLIRRSSPFTQTLQRFDEVMREMKEDGAAERILSRYQSS